MRSGYPPLSAKGLGLDEVILALRDILPADPRRPVDLETGFGFNCLIQHGWDGMLRSYTVQAEGDFRSVRQLRYFMDYRGRIANARGTGPDRLDPSDPLGTVLGPPMSVFQKTCSSFVYLRSTYPQLYQAIHDRIEHLLASRRSYSSLASTTPAPQPVHRENRVIRF